MTGRASFEKRCWSSPFENDGSNDHLDTLLEEDEEERGDPREAMGKDLPFSSSLYDTGSFCSEVSRYDSLDSCGILYTAPEARFDSITTLAAGIYDVPVAIVTLVASDIVWFKSSHGPFEGCVKREGSFCSYVTVPDFAEVLIVEDATQDARFSHNPFVAGPPDLRFYAGCPLVTSAGHRIGTLCICDFQPRRFPATAYNLMCNLAEIIAREVEREVMDQQLDNNSVLAAAPLAAAAAREPILLVDTSDPAWPLVFGNEALAEALGVDAADLQDESFWEIFSAGDEGADVAQLRARLDADEPAVVRGHLPGQAGAGHARYEVRFCSASRSRLKNSAAVSIPGFVAADESAEAVMPPHAVPLHALWIGTLRVIKPATTLGFGRSASCASMLSTTSSTFSSRSTRSAASTTKPHPLSAVQLGPLLGQGAFGKVYRGTLKSKAVAIKVMDLLPPARTVSKRRYSSGLSDSDASSGGDVSAAVVMEAVLSRRLAHPNIVPTLDFVVNYEGETPKTMWIVQHLCDRGSLYDAVNRGTLREAPLITAEPSLPAVVDTALDIASALEYLHEEGTLHCDLSGHNVLLASSASSARGFVALVSDFGLSRAFQGPGTAQSLGTVTHMAPEVLASGTPSKASDVYSFGVLLWEMWSGQRAWVGANPASIIFQVSIQRKQLKMPEGCPEALRRLAAACMDYSPAARPSFLEVVEALEGVRASQLSAVS